MSAVADLVRPIAHRGLHNAKAGVIENTATAFEAACARGFGVECDLQPASDLEPMVFHDERLGRLTQAKGFVRAASPAALKQIAMRRTRDRMLRLSELLELVAGRVPILIEIKSDWSARDEFAAVIARRLRGYHGPFGLMSFDPRRVKPYCELLPHVPRGIVAGGVRSDLTMPGWIRRWNARKLLRNEIARPDFLAYFVRGLPGAVPVLSRRPATLPLFTWTVRTPADRAKAIRYADAMIFEGFEPEPGRDYQV